MAETRNVDITLESGDQRLSHLRVAALSGREAISQLFTFDLDVVCDPGHDLPEEIVPGNEITLVFEIDGLEVRRVHGLLGPIRDNLDPSDRASYRLRIVPRVFRLTLVETQEIFLDDTVPDIIRAKLERHGFGEADVEMRLLGTYPAREFVVQYRESDLAFISRLAEHLGISFFFEHQNGCDKLVFTDHTEGFRPAPGAEETRFHARRDNVDVFALSVSSDLVPTSYIVQDYNYRTPLVDLSASFDLESGNGGGVVEYGCHAKTPEESERLAKIRAEERLCRQKVFEGKSGRPGFSAGAKTTLSDHPKLPAPETLLLVEVDHEAHFAVFGEESSARETTYANTFRAIPAAVVFRPKRVTPRPQIHGVITGIVQPGADGETGGIAKIDSEGRYTIQFHFDTTAPGEQKASHPVRMAQPFAGSNYGMHLPLRPGTEVALAFAHGDPDRPVIVGALYNAASPSPVVASNAQRHQIKASTGAIFEFGSKS